LTTPIGGSDAATLVRCPWAGSDPLMRDYHDLEWGRPLHDDRRLFEMLCLEAAQAGLSWDLILRRREGYRAVYEGFDPAVIAGWDDVRQAALLADPRIIRNRAKVAAFRDNARATLAVQREVGSLDTYLWSFVRGQPIVNRPARLDQVPAQTRESEALSRDLRARGFRFVGPVIVYALMQSVGLVDDHLADCFVRPGGAG
jgi:DNA-3-methyladenine glycosylase I